MSILIVFLTTILLLLSAFVVLVILMQKPNANAGMGSALGGGAAEQAFGGDAANVLTKTTVFSIVAFFVLAFGLYLGNLAMTDTSARTDGGEELQSLVSGFAEEAQNEVTEEAPTATEVDESAAVSLDAILDDTKENTEKAPETPAPAE